MKTITFQFVRGEEFVSHLIEWKGDSEVSHVNVVTPDGKLLGSLMDGGVQARPADYAKFALQILVSIPVTDEQYDAFWKDAYSTVGEKYDKAGIIGIALGRNIHAQGQNFCSEWGTRRVNRDSPANVLWIAKDPSKIDPETLRLLLTAIPGATEQRITANAGLSAHAGT
jgi:hypothetical protein